VKEHNMAKKPGREKDDKQSPDGNRVKRDPSGEWQAVRHADSYGTYKGQALPPPGRDNIIVRTPNPLPAPKERDS
jgi:hypothetical protein